jgi:hypothetical protein
MKIVKSEVKNVQKIFIQLEDGSFLSKENKDTIYIEGIRGKETNMELEVSHEDICKLRILYNEYFRLLNQLKTTTKEHDNLYYAIFDLQTKCYLHTGYNSKSKNEILSAYISYKSVDTDMLDLTMSDSVEKYLIEDDFEIHTSKEPFKKLEQ